MDTIHKIIVERTNHFPSCLNLLYSSIDKTKPRVPIITPIVANIIPLVGTKNDKIAKIKASFDLVIFSFIKL
ncbi:hypothetical protein ACFVR2_17450 [Gottfriedia sp. NPDC057991]|uniref:hypothetical protein n=1 Tax=Gottfriedia sp. NPDC057991 TaxID=3346298 RepID=UPI0036DB0961